METETNNVVENLGPNVDVYVVEQPTIKEQALAAVVVTGVTVGLYAVGYGAAVLISKGVEYVGDKRHQRKLKARVKAELKEEMNTTKED